MTEIKSSRTFTTKRGVTKTINKSKTRMNRRERKLANKKFARDAFLNPEFQSTLRRGLTVTGLTTASANLASMFNQSAGLSTNNSQFGRDNSFDKYLKSLSMESTEEDYL